MHQEPTLGVSGITFNTVHWGKAITVNHVKKLC